MEDFESLARILELNVDELRSMVFGASYYYREYKIPKRTAGFRQLMVPIDVLKKTQRIIQRKILHSYKPCDCVHAYCLEKSIVTNATVHKDAQVMLKLDLENFFGNIKYDSVYGAFSWLRENGGRINDNGTLMEFKEQYLRWLTLLCCYYGRLPQGAPTSPILSNMVARDIDIVLSKHCESINVKYTRYSDDMTFSSLDDISKKERRNIMKLIEGKGYKINIEKISYVPRGKDKFITGLYLADDGLRLPKVRRREIRSYVFNFKNLRDKGVMTPGDLEKMKSRVLGKINYWLRIEPMAKYPLIEKWKIVDC
jgi:RNA-directed DNA polymerase